MHAESFFFGEIGCPLCFFKPFPTLTVFLLSCRFCRYHETNVRVEHVRKVQLGLFTETFDDGLDARKTAFECLFTVLERCYDFVIIPEFIHEIAKGLADQHDIQVKSFLADTL